MGWIENEEYECFDIHWSDLPSLSLIEGYGHNFFNVGKVIVESDDWLLNMT